jgi:hypothetical protein
VFKFITHETKMIWGFHCIWKIPREYGTSLIGKVALEAATQLNDVKRNS